MRQAAKVVAVVSMMTAMSWASVSEAAFFSFPRALKFQIAQTDFNAPILLPSSPSEFCPAQRQLIELGFIWRGED